MLDLGLTLDGLMYLRLLHQLHELSYRRDAELLHQAATVDLHRFLRHAKLSSDLLI